ncbi:hypothetical protein BGZ63DRAFT_408498 [Mariannaea sp. PMI_226]|nr:hypothetical protein BGZ63DRAFT_408498 [Mariannaea sp. PMI_226]
MFNVPDQHWGFPLNGKPGVQDDNLTLCIPATEFLWDILDSNMGEQGRVFRSTRSASLLQPRLLENTGSRLLSARQAKKRQISTRVGDDRGIPAVLLKDMLLLLSLNSPKASNQAHTTIALRIYWIPSALRTSS